MWLLSQYAQAGALGKNIQLIELGPGRGTLMNDVLRVSLGSKVAPVSVSSMRSGRP